MLMSRRWRRNSPPRHRIAVLYPAAIALTLALPVGSAALVATTSRPHVALTGNDGADVGSRHSGKADHPAAQPNPIAAKYEELGGAKGRLGPTVGVELLLPGGSGRFQIYDGGVIVWTPALGVQVAPTR